jgi:SAM-dependent methyltransferase
LTRAATACPKLSNELGDGARPDAPFVTARSTTCDIFDVTFMKTDGSIEYSINFYDKITAEGRSSAAVVVPLVVKLLSPRRVLDVGCGLGAWLECFLQHGITDVFGVDGSWVDLSRLVVSSQHFKVVDLKGKWSAPLGFDLAVCLEVGEHLPHASAAHLVTQLTAAASAVLFSAALPGQEGTDHVNEQWPDYWLDLFRQQGFERLDPIRRHIWQRLDVAWYYQQNLFLFVKRELIDRSPTLQDELEIASRCALTLVHPKILRPTRSLSRAIRLLPRLAVSAFKRRWVKQRNTSNHMKS